MLFGTKIQYFRGTTQVAEPFWLDRSYSLNAGGNGNAYTRVQSLIASALRYFSSSVLLLSLHPEPNFQPMIRSLFQAARRTRGSSSSPLLFGLCHYMPQAAALSSKIFYSSSILSAVFTTAQPAHESKQEATRVGHQTSRTVQFCLRHYAVASSMSSLRRIQVPLCYPSLVPFPCGRTYLAASISQHPQSSDALRLPD